MRLIRAWSLILCSSFFSSAAGAQTLELPALGDAATIEHHVGKMIWADLITPDLAAAQRFYGALFGWTFAAVSTGHSDYAVALADGHPVGGLVQRAIPAGEHRQSAWLTFLAVADVDAARGTALSHGAKSLSLPRTYRGRGRQAVLADPEGAVFAILASTAGDLPDSLAAPGEWLWSTVLAQDAAQSAAFYQTVFGYEVFELAAAHLVLSSDGFARGGVNTLPPGAAHRRAHWLNFIRVSSVSESVGKARSLGGSVLVEPHWDRHGDQTAVLADPLGAPIGIMEWSAGGSKALTP